MRLLRENVRNLLALLLLLAALFGSPKATAAVEAAPAVPGCNALFWHVCTAHEDRDAVCAGLCGSGCGGGTYVSGSSCDTGTINCYCAEECCPTP